jgi:hypothetical protein
MRTPLGPCHKSICAFGLSDKEVSRCACRSSKPMLPASVSTYCARSSPDSARWRSWSMSAAQTQSQTQAEIRAQTREFETEMDRMEAAISGLREDIARQGEYFEAEFGRVVFRLGLVVTADPCTAANDLCAKRTRSPHRLPQRQRACLIRLRPGSVESSSSSLTFSSSRSVTM